MKNLFIMHTQYNLILSSAVMTRYKNSENILVLYSEFTLSESLYNVLATLFDKVIVVRDKFMPIMKTLDEVRFTRQCLKKVRPIWDEHFDNVFMSQERTFDLILCDRTKKINPVVKCYNIEEDAYYSINEKYNADDYIHRESIKTKVRKFLISLLYLGYPYNYKDVNYCYGMSEEYNGANLLFPHLARRELSGKELYEINRNELVDGIQKIYSTIDVAYPPSETYTVFFFDLMSRYQDLDRVKSIVMEIINISQEEGRTVLLKYHPRETDKFSNVNNVYELPSLIPAEKILFDLNGKDTIIIGNATTSCVVAAKLGLKVISICKLEFPTNMKMHRVMKKMGIFCACGIDQIKDIMKKEN